MDWVAWMDDPHRPARQALLEARAARGDAVEPDGVDLLPANRDAAAVYMLTRHQVVTVGDGRPIDLNLTAVKAAMDMFEVSRQRACVEKVMTLWRNVDAERWKPEDHARQGVGPDRPV
jgi:hypothetical protein